jgi:hypothetical protein
MSDINNLFNLNTSNSDEDDKRTPCVSCGIAIPMGAKHCPGCGSNQGTVQEAPSSPVAGGLSIIPTVTADRETPSPVIEFRASDNIWSHEEREPRILPEKPRPLLIVDEETVVLNHTDKRLSPDELLDRVKARIEAQNVPVEARLSTARWVNDHKEVRPRIVANLKDHTFSDLKMILGLDYMGGWASLQYQIGFQPDPVPATPPTVESKNWGPTILIVIGIVFLFLPPIGIALIIAGLVWRLKVKKDIEAKRQERQRQINRQSDLQYQKTRMQISRTFKIDDMKLFQTAMRVVFQDVVDDIVQSGGEVVKEVKGGRSDFFMGQSQTNAESTTSVVDTSEMVKSDASDLGI